MLIFLNGRLVPATALALDDPLANLDAGTLHAPIDDALAGVSRPVEGALVGGSRAAKLRAATPSAPANAPTTAVTRMQASPALAPSLSRLPSAARDIAHSRARTRGGLVATACVAAAAHAHNGPPVVTNALRNVLPDDG